MLILSACIFFCFMTTINKHTWMQPWMFSMFSRSSSGLSTKHQRCGMFSQPVYRGKHCIRYQLHLFKRHDMYHVRQPVSCRLQVCTFMLQSSSFMIKKFGKYWNQSSKIDLVPKFNIQSRFCLSGRKFCKLKILTSKLTILINFLPLRKNSS